MFKLTVVHGPGKGMSIKLEEGERSLGRAPGNDVVLPSQQVSKRHCVLRVFGDEVVLEDAGSSNGTFVNGALVKSRTLLSGDRISIGDCVVELTQIETSNVVPLRGVPTFPGMHMNPELLGAGGADSNSQMNAQLSSPNAQVAVSFKEKIQQHFEKVVLNFLFNLNEKQEWRTIMISLFFILCVGGAVSAVYPVMDRSMNKLEHEAKERAAFLSRQIVDRNSGFLFEKMESKVDVGFAEREKGVIGAYVVDLEGRVIAPARKANQFLTDTNEASFVAVARDQFYKKEKLEEFSKVYGKTVFVATPLRVFVPGSGKNMTIAVGVVGFDREALLFDEGTLALAYIQAIILVAILTVLIFSSIYRLTLKPLVHLNQEVDSVLKGNSSSIHRKYKMEEIDSLIDIINVALQRASGSGGGQSNTMDSLSSEEVLNSYKFFADQTETMGVILLSAEKNVLHLNTAMEEITGIRYAMAAGAEFSTVARDEAFTAFVSDITGRVIPGGAGITEDFEFSGSPYRMNCFAIGAGGFTKFCILTAVKIS